MMQEPSETEHMPKESIVVSKEVIRPFGRALNQMFEGPVSRMVTHGASLQRLFPRQEEFANYIKQSIAQLTQTLSNIESSKEVRLVSPGGNVFTFGFSEEKDPVVVIPQGEVIIDRELSQKLVQACSDTLRNQLGGAYGFSPEISEDKLESEEVKQAAGEIHAAAREFLDIYNQNFTEPGEFKVATDDAGNSTITSIREESQN